MSARKGWLWLVAVFVGVGLAPGGATAQVHVTNILSSADTDDPFDANIEVHYEFISSRADILREFPCYAPGDGLCQGESTVLLGKELRYSRVQHIVHLRPRIGLYHDLELFVDLPIVAFEQSRLDFASGVGPGNSSAAQQELFALPFRGPQRRGVGDLSVGLKYAPLNYDRDPTQPTWIIGATYTAPTGSIRKGGNTGVGYGIHALDLYTAISRRALSWLEPYFSFHGTLRFPSANGLFVDRGRLGTQTLVKPGDILGLKFGVEFVPWEHRATDRRFEIDLGFAGDYTFEGREYGPLFEALAQSPCSADPGCVYTKHTRDLREGATSGSASTTDGITDVEAYGTFSGWIGVHYQPERHVQIGTRFSVRRITDHFLTNADPGKDLDDDGVVTQSSQAGDEYNPVYVEWIDAPAGDPYTGKEATRFRASNFFDLAFQFYVAGKF